MSSIREVVRRAFRIPRRLKTQRELSRLSSQADVTSKLLLSALKDTLENKLTPEEQAWIDRIELLRQALNDSTTEISVVDYGAGLSDFQLTDEVMDQGRAVTRTIGEICRSNSKSRSWSLLLFKLIREFKPSVCLELGTCLGVSTAYQEAALKLNKQGRIITLEGSESLASLANQNFQTLGLDNVSVVVGRFQDTLDNVLNEQGPIDYAFIDGHHDEKATLAYFWQIYPFLTSSAVLVFDDISWSKGMQRAWNAIEVDERVNISINLSDIGICLIDSDIPSKTSFKIPMT
jgi:predicted O-methyltransferase YrrM